MSVLFRSLILKSDQNNLPQFCHIRSAVMFIAALIIVSMTCTRKCGCFQGGVRLNVGLHIQCTFSDVVAMFLLKKVVYRTNLIVCIFKEEEGIAPKRGRLAATPKRSAISEAVGSPTLRKKSGPPKVMFTGVTHDGAEKVKN